MSYYFSLWYLKVQQHFQAAFDFTRSLCSRISNFALGVIALLPIIGQLYVGLDWLLSRIKKPEFPSDVDQIVRVEHVVGHDHRSRVEDILKRQRLSLEPRDEGKVHGDLPSAPFF